jgi:hypothetical protein
MVAGPNQIFKCNLKWLGRTKEQEQRLAMERINQSGIVAKNSTGPLSLILLTNHRLFWSRGLSPVLVPSHFKVPFVLWIYVSSETGRWCTVCPTEMKSMFESDKTVITQRIDWLTDWLTDWEDVQYSQKHQKIYRHQATEWLSSYTVTTETKTFNP